jgi:AcrR family transcriptional regulator
MPRTGLTSEEIKEKAVAYAEANIRRFGFEKFRLVDIAKNLGVSHVALYNHFPDKSALLDIVSQKWLRSVDQTLKRICEKEKKPTERIVEFFLKLHQLKREKVQNDPELFKAFNSASERLKPFVINHLHTQFDLLRNLVTEALAKGELHGENADRMTQILLETTISFHHPRLVAERLHEKREPSLKRLVGVVLKGLAA